jgi:hypothetical protein
VDPTTSRRRAARPWALRAGLSPALRRGAWAALPVGAALLLELTLDDAVAGALATGALIAGLIAFDAPARVRARWQLTAAPCIGIAAALGVLSDGSDLLAVMAMALAAGLAGYCVAVSPRFALAAVSCALALLIAQGLYLEPDQAGEALLLGTCGGLLQAAWSLVAWVLGDRAREPGRVGEAARGAWLRLRAELRPKSLSLRHGLRFGAALGAGVATYRIIDLGPHGYWVPLTTLFVLRPAHGDTIDRLAMRAAGTVAGLLVATVLAELLGEQPVPTALVLTVSAALAFALLAIEYALFTAAITAYVVLLTDDLGAPALDAAGHRALATALGIAIAALSFVVIRDERPWPPRDDHR